MKNLSNESGIKWNDELSDEAYELSQIEFAAKLVGTIDNKERPHITFIVSNKAKNKNQIVWGQFCEGTSKKNIFNNPKQGIFMMTPESPYKFFQAKVKLDYVKKEGEEVESFSRMDFYRYNCYMNVHTAFYNEVIAATPVRDLSILGILKGIFLNLIGKGGVKSKDADKKLPNLGYELFNGLISPKFISYIDPNDGYPIIIPCFQMRAPDHSKLIFTLSQFKKDLEAIPLGTDVASLAMDLEPLIIHANGKLIKYDRFRGVKYGIIEIEEVYNPMPPLAGVIYPKIQTRPKVRDFHL